MSFLFLTIAIIVAIWFYKNTIPKLPTSKKWFLITLRAISLCIILILLLNPIINLIKEKIQKPLAIMLIDNSESMNIINGKENSKKNKTSYFIELQNILDKKLSSKFRVKKYSFASTLEGDINSSNIETTFEKLFTKDSANEIDEIFLFSDGWFKNDNYDFLNNITIPINPIIPEINNNNSDLLIKEINCNKTAFFNEISPISINVQSFQYSGKAKLNLKINKTIVKSKIVDFKNNNYQNILFNFDFSNLGLNTISAEISATNLQETNLANNKFDTVIKVDNKKTKIVIIADKINWDIKFLIDALKTDTKFDINFLTKNMNLYIGSSQTDLQNELNETDLIFLVNNSKLLFNSAEKKLIDNYHQNGGSIIFMGNFLSQFSEILPSTKSAIKTEFTSTLLLTKESKKYLTLDIDTSQIPPVRYHYLRPKAQAEVLMTLANEQRSPAILFDKTTGKIMQISVQDLWRWQMQNPENHYNIFFVNLVNWMSINNENSFVCFTDKNSYFPGEKITVELTAYDEKLIKLKNINAKLELYKSKNKIQTKYLKNINGKCYIDLENLVAGEYQYTIIDDKTKQKAGGEFIIFNDSDEARDLGINKPMLNYLAKVSDGKIITEKNINQQEFIAVEKKIQLKREIPIYKKKWFILLFLLSFCSELFFRKIWGLL